jgi:beta-lactamase regulating signal transducer with metallopeptidase domain
MDSAQFMQGILESLGWAILHSFWQMALVWLVYQMLFGSRVRVSPLVRHNAAVLAMLVGTAWFMATFVQEYNNYISVERYLALVPDALPATGSVAASEISVSWTVQALTAFLSDHVAWLSTVYLCMLALMGWKLMQGFLQIHNLRTKGLVPAGIDIQKQVQQLARRLSIPFQVQVHLSSLVDVPATLGVLKPVVLLPVACVTQLSPAQLESILLHELAHIRRMDYFVNLVVGLMETILVHNPFAWWLARSIRRERELCCDDIVLAQRQDALEYAAALFTLEQQRRLPAAALAMASSGQQGQLLQRIRRITSRPTTMMAQPHRLMAVGLMFLLMLTMAWVRPPASRAETPLVGTRLSLGSGEISRVILAPAPRDLTRPAPPRRTATEKIIRNSSKPNSLSENRIDEDSEPVIPSPPDLARSSPRVYVNEAPPESFMFTFKRPAEEEALVFIPGMPDITAISPGWTPTAPRHRSIIPDAQVMLDREWQSLQKQQENLERMIEAELEQQQALEAFGNAKVKRQSGQQSRTAPRPVPARPGPMHAPHQVNIERIMQGQSLAPQEWREIYLHEVPADIMKRVQAPRNLTKETVRVNRIKTRDGYTLRILTEKESIDIRIAEDEIVVEKD